MKKPVPFWFRSLKLTVVFVVIFIGAIAGVLYFAFGREAKHALVEQMLHREQVIARSGAKSLDSMFSLFSRSFLFLVKDGRISLSDKKSLTLLEEFVDSWQGTPFSGLILVNKEGVIVANPNRSKIPQIDGSVANRDYFVWAKGAEAGEFFLGRPVISRAGPTRGKYIIPFATPLISNDEFDGVLGGAFVIEEMIEEYLSPLRISAKTKIILVSSDGTIYLAPRQDLLGVNFIDYINENPFLGSGVITELLKEKVGNREEGKLDIVIPSFEDETKLERTLIAYSPLKVGDSLWYLAVMTPVDDALVFITPFYINLLLIILAVFVVLLIVVIRIAKVQAYDEVREENLKKEYGERGAR